MHCSSMLYVVNTSNQPSSCLYMHIPQCDYDKAVECFGRCCQICSELDDTEALHQARVQYGIARGHQMMGGFFSCVSDSSSRGLQATVGWKDARRDPDSTKTEDIQISDVESIDEPDHEDQVDDTVVSANGETNEEEGSSKLDTDNPTQVT